MPKDFQLENLSPAELDARLAAAGTVYGQGSRSYNRSAEKKESKAQQAVVTARYEAGPRSEVTVGPICTCRSFNLPHELKRHNELGRRGDMEWRTEAERRGIEYRPERIS